jgi:hypothetical protein
MDREDIRVFHNPCKQCQTGLNPSFTAITRVQIPSGTPARLNNPLRVGADSDPRKECGFGRKWGHLAPKNRKESTKIEEGFEV